MRKDIKFIPKLELLEAIDKANLPKDRLARNAGIAGSTLRSVLSGLNLRKENAEKLSVALGKDVLDLFQPQEDNGLADITILHHHLICAMLNTAVQWQMLTSNPCLRIKPPRVKKKEARYL